MTTAKIDRVAYIGWRGIVGCEVIDLDEELTGFIGAGGAGKSTLIMCLDYAILPDRRALDIRPVSDLHDSQSAGIDSLAGRIDPRYGYAYVVLDITTRDRQRLIAGIHAEPVDGRATFNLWLIKNPPKDVPVQDLMRCVEGEEIYFPDFPALKRQLSADGIDITTCKTIGEYGQALYEAGVLPSSMNSAADRKLYANLIETTFRGGISQEVATRLKDYLLPAQSQVQDLVRGLQECTNEVLKTRNAVADADKELALLESTYGIGKETVLTALRCMADDAATSQAAVSSLQSQLANKDATRLSLEETIPAVKAEIAVAEQTKKNKLEASILMLREHEEKKDAAFQQLGERETELEKAAAKRSQFDKGAKLWGMVAGPRIKHDGYETAHEWLDTELERVNRDIYSIDVEIKKLKEEEARLTADQASIASEHLADVLGGQTLEQALGHVSDKEALALEMSLGGLVDGVVGVDLDTLSDIAPTEDMPDMFWLGKQLPDARPARETGQWYVTARSGGYVVTSKTRTPIFGREARKQRRAAIASDLEKLMGRRGDKKQEVDRIKGRKDTLLMNHEVINFYLTNRNDALAIDKAEKDAQKAFDLCKAEHEAAKKTCSNLQDEIAKVQEPYDERIRELNRKLSKDEQSLSGLLAEVAEVQKRLQEEQAHLSGCLEELASAKNLLGGEFDRFQAECMGLVLAARNITGQQAQRIAELGQALGSEGAQLESFRNVNAEDRVSVVRLWPDLMTIVLETANIDLADSDGGDLIQMMRDQRSKLDGDLALWETELGIKAKNIYMSISGAVKSQQVKIGRLSKLGQVIEFGNVTGIQIKLAPRTRLLDILQQFADQLTLFTKDKPVDQVLKEFFDASIAGGVKMSGEQLLDYRNYVDLAIEARRKGGDWELASSLSGTESIGGGLAIALMLIRSIASRGEAGSSGVKVGDIRPLFAVDEASRLDPDGQRMLVEFAKREQFQLLVTAPTLKPTYDCKLYALHRHFDPHERLIIRGIKHRASVRQPAA